MASNALNEALYRLRNLSNNRQREGDAAASINQINAVLKLISSEIDQLVISGGGVTDHEQLTGKNAADQHSMSAITGLVAALNGKQASNSNLGLIAQLTSAGVLQRKSDNTWELITHVQQIHIGTSAPSDTTMLWIDTN